MNSIYLFYYCFVVLLSTFCWAAVPTYQDLVLSTTYNVGDTEVSNGVDIRFRCFEHPGSGGTCASTAEIVAAVPGCTTQNTLHTNNINAQFDYAGSVGALTNPTFQCNERGGNINLAINGDFRNFEDFIDIDGQVVGGCTVQVLSGGGGQDCGEVKFLGTVNVLLVGGQEFDWDGKFEEDPEPEGDTDDDKCDCPRWRIFCWIFSAG